MILFRKILSLALVILFVGYAGGINIAKHFCAGKVVSVAVNYKVKECKKSSCEIEFSSEKTAIHKSNCCDTEMDFFKTLTFENISFPIIIDIPQSFDDVFNIVPKMELKTSEVFILNKPPPITKTPIYIKIESFLI